mmetsp:Transcript_12457/g.18595  ORF Transcript_12457/g.18595 Transcript_12457/m.18595 type:complete len:187 (-) Transcript_12457:78-638(-)
MAPLFLLLGFFVASSQSTLRSRVAGPSPAIYRTKYRSSKHFLQNRCSQGVERHRVRSLVARAVPGKRKDEVDPDNPYAKLQMEAQRQRELEDDFIPDSKLNQVISFGSVKETIDSFLVADFFFICASLAWLAAGVAAKLALKTEAIYLAWYSLWTPIFQPALGLLMAGAIVSGVGGWLDENRNNDA